MVFPGDAEDVGSLRSLGGCSPHGFSTTEVANDIVTQLTEPEGCLAELQGAAHHLDRCGFVRTWRVAPRLATSCVFLFEYHHRETMVLPQLFCCLIRPISGGTQSGPGSSSVFHGSSSSVKCSPCCSARCFSRGRDCPQLDKLLGRHRGARPRSSRLRSRALPMERTLARVCREAGATVRCNCRLRDMSVTVRADNERVLEVLASSSRCPTYLTSL